jgi:hypothetical protein
MVSAAEAALLREKANRLREAMRRSEAMRDESAATVASVGGHMAAVDDAVRPAQVLAPPRSTPLPQKKYLVADGVVCFDCRRGR